MHSSFSILGRTACQSTQNKRMKIRKTRHIFSPWPFSHFVLTWANQENSGCPIPSYAITVIVKLRLGHLTSWGYYIGYIGYYIGLALRILLLPAASAQIQWKLKRGLGRATAQHMTDFWKEKCCNVALLYKGIHYTHNTSVYMLLQGYIIQIL